MDWMEIEGFPHCRHCGHALTQRDFELDSCPGCSGEDGWSDEGEHPHESSFIARTKAFIESVDDSGGVYTTGSVEWWLHPHARAPIISTQILGGLALFFGGLAAWGIGVAGIFIPGLWDIWMPALGYVAYAFGAVWAIMVGGWLVFVSPFILFDQATRLYIYSSAGKK